MSQKATYLCTIYRALSFSTSNLQVDSSEAERYIVETMPLRLRLELLLGGVTAWRKSHLNGLFLGSSEKLHLGIWCLGAMASEAGVIWACSERSSLVGKC